MSLARQRICDIVFQILFKMAHADTEKIHLSEQLNTDKSRVDYPI